MTPADVAASPAARIAPAEGAAPPRVALAGVHGFGRIHLARLLQYQDQGFCRLVGVADPAPPEPGTRLDPSVEVFDDLAALLATTAVDVVVVSTPIHTHAPLAEAAMRAGAHVLLEKPPAPSMAEFSRLERVSAETGMRVQIGFQSLGSAAVLALREAVAAGALGEIRSIAARCCWVRPADYFTRSPWAGHRELNGIAVMDGVLTNPLAHAVATALAVDGSDRVADVLAVEPDLFRANDIRTDDTSAVRIRTRRGTSLLLAATLCAAEHTEPEVVVYGSAATAVLSYTEDTIRIEPAPGQDEIAPELVGLVGEHGRADLVANLLAHRADPSVPLLAELGRTGAFTAVLEALRTAEPPAAIPSSCAHWADGTRGRHLVVDGVERWVQLAAERGRTFTELGAPWTARADAGRPVPLCIDDTVVAQYDPGLDVAPTSSPRPFLHPVRTLGGLTVTDAHPADHDWHLGIGVAVQDVAGWNLWGGRTYVRGSGYTWRPDHGRIEHVGWADRGPGRSAEDLRWLDPTDRVLLHERRTLRWGRPAEPEFTAWLLDFEFTLTPPGGEPVELGSPGSNGREGGGYGGFFWRLPPVDELDVCTPHARGELAVHGSVAPWLCARPRIGADRATLLVQPLDPVSAAPRPG